MEKAAATTPTLLSLNPITTYLNSLSASYSRFVPSLSLLGGAALQRLCICFWVAQRFQRCDNSSI
jgi:hypothetical protein